MGTGSFPVVKRPGRGIDHPPHLAPRLSRAIPLLSLWTFVTFSRVNFNYIIIIIIIIIIVVVITSMVVDRNGVVLLILVI
jgi:hypothetical protein